MFVISRVFLSLKESSQNVLMLLVLIVLPLLSPSILAQEVEMEFTLPVIQTGQYQRPYVAVWVETSKGKAVKTLAIWHEDKKWLKDLRRWWRKAGRYQKENLDAVTGATKAPGQFTLLWDGKDHKGVSLPAGEYQLCFEASREHGSRTLLKQKFQLPASGQSYQLKAGTELGPVVIRLL